MERNVSCRGQSKSPARTERGCCCFLVARWLEGVAAAPAVMAGIGNNYAVFDHQLAANLQQQARRQQEQAAQAEAGLLAKASLSDLLAGADRSVVFARARNRALVAARELQLPTILRDLKTDELSALVVKIEQTILDLDHECEVAKDQTQQPVAGAAAGAANLDELRGLAICYRERIELLKPILSVLKEEIANRAR